MYNFKNILQLDILMFNQEYKCSIIFTNYNFLINISFMKIKFNRKYCYSIAYTSFKLQIFILN